MKKLFLGLALALALVFAPAVASAAGGKSGVQSNNFVQYLFTNTAYTAPTTTYAGLMSTCPANAGSINYTDNGTELTSGSSSGYARSAKYNGSAGGIPRTGGWTYSAASGTSNPAKVVLAQLVEFGAATGNWVAACCFGVYDAASTGNLLYWGPLTGVTLAANGTCTGGIVVGNGSVASFAAGASGITITEQ